MQNIKGFSTGRRLKRERHLKCRVFDVGMHPVLTDFLSMPQIFLSEAADWRIITRFFYEFPVHALQRRLPAVAAPTGGFQLARAIVKDHHDVWNMEGLLAVDPLGLSGSEGKGVGHKDDTAEADVFAAPVIGDVAGLGWQRASLNMKLLFEKREFSLLGLDSSLKWRKGHSGQFAHEIIDGQIRSAASSCPCPSLPLQRTLRQDEGGAIDRCHLVFDEGECCKQELNLWCDYYCREIVHELAGAVDKLPKALYLTRINSYIAASLPIGASKRQAIALVPLPPPSNRISMEFKACSCKTRFTVTEIHWRSTQKSVLKTRTNP
jgi:hypothetical protein